MPAVIHDDLCYEIKVVNARYRTLSMSGRRARDLGNDSTNKSTYPFETGALQTRRDERLCRGPDLLVSTQIGTTFSNRAPALPTEERL